MATKNEVNYNGKILLLDDEAYQMYEDLKKYILKQKQLNEILTKENIDLELRGLVFHSEGWYLLRLAILLIFNIIQFIAILNLI